MEHPPDRRPRRTPALPSEVTRIVGIFGPGTKAGYWEPHARIEAASVFGSVKLDFAEANVYEGVTEIQCASIFGSIEILVPAEIDVDANGIGVFGGFVQRGAKKNWLERVARTVRGEDEVDEEGVPLVIAEGVEPPLLRIRGFCLFGNVTVRVG